MAECCSDIYSVTCNETVDAAYLKDILSCARDSNGNTLAGKITWNNTYHPTKKEIIDTVGTASIAGSGNWEQNVDGVVIANSVANNETVRKSDITAYCTTLVSVVLSNGGNTNCPSQGNINPECPTSICEARTEYEYPILYVDCDASGSKTLNYTYTSTTITKECVYTTATTTSSVTVNVTCNKTGNERTIRESNPKVVQRGGCTCPCETATTGVTWEDVIVPCTGATTVTGYYTPYTSFTDPSYCETQYGPKSSTSITVNVGCNTTGSEIIIQANNPTIKQAADCSCPCTVGSTGIEWEEITVPCTGATTVDGWGTPYTAYTESRCPTQYGEMIYQEFRVDAGCNDTGVDKVLQESNPRIIQKSDCTCDDGCDEYEYLILPQGEIPDTELVNDYNIVHFISVDLCGETQQITLDVWRRCFDHSTFSGYGIWRNVSEEAWRENGISYFFDIWGDIPPEYIHYMGGKGQFEVTIPSKVENEATNELFSKYTAQFYINGAPGMVNKNTITYVFEQGYSYCGADPNLRCTQGYEYCTVISGEPPRTTYMDKDKTYEDIDVCGSEIDVQLEVYRRCIGFTQWENVSAEAWGEGYNASINASANVQHVSNGRYKVTIPAKASGAGQMAYYFSISVEGPRSTRSYSQNFTFIQPSGLCDTICNCGISTLRTYSVSSTAKPPTTVNEDGTSMFVMEGGRFLVGTFDVDSECVSHSITARCGSRLVTNITAEWSTEGVEPGQPAGKVYATLPDLSNECGGELYTTHEITLTYKLVDTNTECSASFYVYQMKNNQACPVVCDCISSMYTYQMSDKTNPPTTVNEVGTSMFVMGGGRFLVGMFDVETECVSHSITATCDSPLVTNITAEWSTEGIDPDQSPGTVYATLPDLSNTCGGELYTSYTITLTYKLVDGSDTECFTTFNVYQMRNNQKCLSDCDCSSALTVNSVSSTLNPPTTVNQSETSMHGMEEQPPIRIALLTVDTECVAGSITCTCDSPLLTNITADPSAGEVTAKLPDLSDTCGGELYTSYTVTLTYTLVSGQECSASFNVYQMRNNQECPPDCACGESALVAGSVSGTLNPPTTVNQPGTSMHGMEGQSSILIGNFSANTECVANSITCSCDSPLVANIRADWEKGEVYADLPDLSDTCGGELYTSYTVTLTYTLVSGQECSASFDVYQMRNNQECPRDCECDDIKFDNLPNVIEWQYNDIGDAIYYITASCGYITTAITGTDAEKFLVTTGTTSSGFYVRAKPKDTNGTNNDKSAKLTITVYKGSDNICGTKDIELVQSPKAADEYEYSATCQYNCEFGYVACWNSEKDNKLNPVMVGYRKYTTATTWSSYTAMGWKWERTSGDDFTTIDSTSAQFPYIYPKKGKNTESSVLSDTWTWTAFHSGNEANVVATGTVTVTQAAECTPCYCSSVTWTDGSYLSWGSADTSTKTCTASYGENCVVEITAKVTGDFSASTNGNQVSVAPKAVNNNVYGKSGQLTISYSVDDSACVDKVWNLYQEGKGVEPVPCTCAEDAPTIIPSSVSWPNGNQDWQPIIFSGKACYGWKCYAGANSLSRDGNIYLDFGDSFEIDCDSLNTTITNSIKVRPKNANRSTTVTDTLRINPTDDSGKVCYKGGVTLTALGGDTGKCDCNNLSIYDKGSNDGLWAYDSTTNITLKYSGHSSDCEIYVYLVNNESHWSVNSATTGQITVQPTSNNTSDSDIVTDLRVEVYEKGNTGHTGDTLCEDNVSLIHKADDTDPCDGVSCGDSALQAGSLTSITKRPTFVNDPDATMHDMYGGSDINIGEFSANTGCISNSITATCDSIRVTNVSANSETGKVTATLPDLSCEIAPLLGLNYVTYKITLKYKINSSSEVCETSFTVYQMREINGCPDPCTCENSPISIIPSKTSLDCNGGEVTFTIDGGCSS